MQARVDGKVTCKRTQQLPTLLGPQCWEYIASVLAMVCKLVQQHLTIRGPAVHRGKDTTHKTLETMYNARARP